VSSLAGGGVTRHRPGGVISGGITPKDETPRNTGVKATSMSREQVHRLDLNLLLVLTANHIDCASLPHPIR
jgi:hypothetical protein